MPARTRRCFPGNRDRGRRRGTASSFQARQWMRSTSAWFRSPNARRMGAQRRPRSERYAAQQLNQLAVSRVGADNRTWDRIYKHGHARQREQPEHPRRYRTAISSIFAPRPGEKTGAVNDLVRQRANREARSKGFKKALERAFVPPPLPHAAVTCTS